MNQKNNVDCAPVNAAVMRDIPQSWIKAYVDQLLDLAKRLENGSAMQSAALMRAEHAMDLVKAFRESAQHPGSPEPTNGIENERLLR